MCCKSNDRPNIRQMEHAIRRNFGGYNLEEGKDAAEVFMEQIKPQLPTVMPKKSDMERRLKYNFRDEFKNDQVKCAELYTIFSASWCEHQRNDLEGTERQVDDEQVQQCCSIVFQ